VADDAAFFREYPARLSRESGRSAVTGVSAVSVNLERRSRSAFLEGNYLGSSGKVRMARETEAALD
jgi:hypothetical protein